MPAQPLMGKYWRNEWCVWCSFWDKKGLIYVCRMLRPFMQLKTSAHPYLQTSEIRAVLSTYVKISTASVKSTHVSERWNKYIRFSCLLLTHFYSCGFSCPLESSLIHPDALLLHRTSVPLLLWCSQMESLKTTLPKTVYAQVSPLLQCMISPGYCRLASKNCVKYTDAYSQHPLNTLMLFDFIE